MRNVVTLIEEVKALPASDQIHLISVITSSLKSSLVAESDAFWNPRSLEKLMKEQDVHPISDLSDLAADFWPEDESIDDFLAYTRRERQESLELDS